MSKIEVHEGDLAARPGRPQSLTAEQAGNSTVVIGLELLKAIARMGRPVALSEIARTMNMSASRTHRYLSSLCQAGFVRKVSDTGRYDIGLATFELGRAAISRIDSMKAARHIMEDLTRDTGLVSYLCVWGSNGPTVIRNEMGDVQTAVRVREGSNLSMLTATGQIFLAHMPENETLSILLRDVEEWNAMSGVEAVTPAQVLKSAMRAKATMLARSTGMRNPTWTAFSSPVFDDGNFVMALTLIGVSKLFDTRMNGAVATRLQSVALRMSATSMGT